MAKLKGAAEIRDFILKCGRARAPTPTTVSRWQKKHVDCPIIKDINGGLYADSEALRAWCLKRKIIPPTRPSDLDDLSAGIEIPETPEELVKEVTGNAELDSFIDVEIFNNHPEPTGDIEDELKEARRLRHLFGRIVFAWKLDTLSNPKTAKAFQDFSAGLIRQISVIGGLEDSLVKQRKRHGQLLDETALDLFAKRISDALIDAIEEAGKKRFDVVNEEVTVLAAESGVDMTLNSDRVIKRWGPIDDEMKREYALAVVKVAEDVQKDQSERLGGDEE